MEPPGPPPPRAVQYGPTPTPKRPNTLMIVLVSIAGLCVLGLVALAALSGPIVSRFQTAMKSRACMDNVRMQSMAMLAYANGVDGRLPSSKYWMANAHMHMPKAHFLVHPGMGTMESADALTDAGPSIPDELQVEGEFYYAMNSKMSRKAVPEMENAQILTFESTNPDWNAADPVESYPKDGFHEFEGTKKVIVSTTAGNAVAMQPQEIERRKKLAK